MAAAQQSAAQVSSLLGGTPASDRRIQDMLNDLLASKSRAELWEVMRMLKTFLGGDREAAKQFFAERPGLTKAVFQTQVLLGEYRWTGKGCGCASAYAWVLSGTTGASLCSCWLALQHITKHAGKAGHTSIARPTTSAGPMRNRQQYMRLVQHSSSPLWSTP